jgi:hypothetical protein
MRNRCPFGFLLFGLPFLLVAPFATLTFSKAQQERSFSATTQQNASVPAVPRSKKLVMKDGTFQIVSSYQIDGDRVRYYSVERSEWEEIPAALVDWPATKQAAASDEKKDAALTSELKANEAAAKSAPIDVDASFEVVPGVILPPGQGFFILDGQTISPLKQSQASAKLDKGHFVEQIAVPIPVVPSRANVDLPGKRASFRTTNVNPEFYFRAADLGEPQIELFVAHVQNGKRRIENIDSYFGQQKHKGKTISMQEWQVAKGLYRFTLGQSLAPGEYALAQFSPKEGINLLLWDFGVDAPPRHNTKKK